MGMSSVSEDDIIARYFRPLATEPGAFALRDDAASLRVPDLHDVVVTTDGIVEGIHFRADDPPETIARKALRVNLSDLAAKGAEPSGFVLALALREVDTVWLEAFAKALGEDARDFACPLLGGDTMRTPGPVTITITALGVLPRGRIVRRAGARVGDAIFVTGTIGDGALGLAVLRDWPCVASLKDQPGFQDFLVRRYRVPEPRIALAAAVRDYASAAMDVSDGFAGDLAKLCTVSGVGAVVEAKRVPLSDAAQAAVAAGGIEVLSRCLTGGDDYELIGTVASHDIDALSAAAQSCGVRVSIVGEVVSGPSEVVIRGGDGTALDLGKGSYQHF